MVILLGYQVLELHALVAVRVSSLISNYASVYEMILFMLLWMVVLLKWFEQRCGTGTS